MIDKPENKRPVAEPDWEKLLAEAKTPDQTADLLEMLFAAADKDLRDKGLSDEEREALLAEILLDRK